MTEARYIQPWTCRFSRDSACSADTSCHADMSCRAPISTLTLGYNLNRWFYVSALPTLKSSMWVDTPQRQWPSYWAETSILIIYPFGVVNRSKNPHAYCMGNEIPSQCEQVENNPLGRLVTGSLHAWHPCCRLSCGGPGGLRQRYPRTFSRGGMLVYTGLDSEDSSQARQ